MDESTVIPRLTLALLAIIGFLSTVRYASENGTLAEVYKLLAVRGPLLLVFWRTILDGSLPTATLSAVYYFTQHLALSMLLMIEAYRVGNAWTAVSFITAVGIIGQNVGMATVAPSYFALYLATSPTVRGAQSYPPAARKTMLLVHPTELQAFPWSIMLGYGVPLALILCCDFDSDGAMYTTKQFWIIMHQIAPLTIGALQLALSIIFTPSDVASRPANERNQEVMKALEKTYAIVSYIGTAGHLSVLVFIGASQLVPNMFARGYKSFFDPINVLQPPGFWLDAKVSNLANGVLYFFQWSNIITSISVLIWALALNRCVADERSPNLVTKLIKTAGQVALIGPVAASSNLVMERDQKLLYEPIEIMKNDDLRGK